MRSHSNSLVQKIRRRRKEGISLRGLEREFGVPNTTISRWVRDITCEEPNFKKARQIESKNRSLFSSLVGGLHINKSGAKVYAAILYWCEGSKYPSSSCLAFSNSDWTLIKTFLELIRLGFDLDESRLRVHLQLHTTHDVKAVTKFWSETLGVEPVKFYKPTVTLPTNRRKRQNYLGTCTLKYFDVKLLLQLTGIFEEFSKKFGEVA